MSDRKTFEPLPEDDYMVRLSRAEEKKTKKGDRMITCGFQVAKGDFKDRLVFENFVVEHDNDKVVEIANEKLDKFLKAVGVEGGLEGIGHDYSQLNDYAELPFVATVKVKESKNPQYGPSNTISSYKMR